MNSNLFTTCVSRYSSCQCVGHKNNVTYSFTACNLYELSMMSYVVEGSASI